MNVKQIMHQHIFEHPGEISHGSSNLLGIQRIDRIYDKKRNQLILMVNSHEMLDAEVNAFLKGYNLLLEASYLLNYSRPFRVHLMDNGVFDNDENDVSVIGFSEIKLKPGYRYTVMSCQLLNPRLIKVILKYTPTFIRKDYIKNAKKRNRR